MSDGRLWFNTKIDNSQVDKGLKELERKIRSSEESIAKNENAKLPLVKQLEQLNKKLTEAKQNLAMLKADAAAAQSAMLPGASVDDYTRASSDLPQLQTAIADQEATIAALQKQWNTVNGKVEKYDLAIQRANTDIERSNVKAQELSEQLNPAAEKMRTAMYKANRSAERFGKRLWEIGKSALLFNLISSGLRSVVKYMGTALKTNSQYTAQLAKLKGALMTAFQPIYEFVLPGLLAVLRILTAIAQFAANVFSFFSGKTVSESVKNAEALNEEADAINAVGGAAKDAQKDLLGFDEINRLSDPNAGGGGGGGGGSAAIAPDFSNMTDMREDLLNILGIVSAIAAGLLAWKIARTFTDSLSMAAGLALAVASAFMYGFNWADAFANGIDWGNLSGMLVGMVGLAVGLGMAFGAVGAALGLLIGSVGLMVTAFTEFARTGKVTDEMLYAIAAGVLGIGVALSLLTGSWIPAAIGAVVGLVTLLGLQFDGVRNAIGAVINWVLSLWQTLVNFASWLANNWMAIFGSFSVIGGETVQTAPMPGIRSVPQLAQGAVIPPNAPFLAMLGDQRSGTNVEAPLATIEQALRNVMAERGGEGIKIEFVGELAALARILAPVITREQNSNAIARGG